MRRPMLGAFDFLRGLPDDDLYLPLVKPHSLEKIRRHNLYAQMFATSMKNRWPQRAYVGLYSGAGRARISETGEIIETTALSVFRLPEPFTKFVFVDSDARCIEALEKRISALPSTHDVSVLRGDVNEIPDRIAAALPRFSAKRGLISFCFVDPFAANLRFDTIRVLGRYKMDFLVLLALGIDARRNFLRYHGDPLDTRIADLIDCPTWRDEYDPARESVIRFILRKFDGAMSGLGYESAKPGHHHPVRVRGTGVMQYVLVLYSKHPLGQSFWESTLASSNPQLGLGLPE